ncbi:hypothetical protein PVL29_013324 [Vitis rotundifolia]|uniref:Uncharacterized protein n=1 Tax=Vitis rotundifolia TaxID=103349 RepID=A0AA38ZL48_VITRO|nr:hypothetical protein PVL29_013324 [Vitis rotundifolia]
MRWSPENQCGKIAALILFRIGFFDKLLNCDQLLQHPFISSSSPNIIFSKADLKSAKERRSCRVEKSRVELEELEGISVESANAVWFQREKRLNCCCLKKYKARNLDSLIRSVGESALTMEILVVNKFRTFVVN